MANALENCLACGAVVDPDFCGLCRACCLIIKAKSDAFAKRSRIMLEKARATSLTIAH